MASDDGYPRALYEKMAALGWAGLVIPPGLGGLGLGMLDLAVLAEEMGRAVLPGPFFSSSVLAALCLMYSNAAAHKKEWLPRIATGEAVGTLALLEDSDRLDPAGITARTNAGGHSRTRKSRALCCNSSCSSDSPKSIGQVVRALGC